MVKVFKSSHLGNKKTVTNLAQKMSKAAAKTSEVVQDVKRNAEQVVEVMAENVLGNRGENVNPNIITKIRSLSANVVTSSSNAAKTASKHVDPPINVAIPNITLESISNRLKFDLRTALGKWNLGESVNPIEMDKILTKIAEVRSDEPFYINPRKGLYSGRKVLYKLKDGSNLILESHNKKYVDNKYVTRVYIIPKGAKENSEYMYLGLDGLFYPDTHFNGETHLPMYKCGDTITWYREGINKYPKSYKS